MIKVITLKKWKDGSKMCLCRDSSRVECRSLSDVRQLPVTVHAPTDIQPGSVGEFICDYGKKYVINMVLTT